jgi:hypothetical protein
MANKLILVPEDIYKGLTNTDTGDINLDVVRKRLENAKKLKTPTSKNVNYNQELRRYLHLLREHENRPINVNVTSSHIPPTNQPYVSNNAPSVVPPAPLSASMNNRYPHPTRSHRSTAEQNSMVGQAPIGGRMNSWMSEDDAADSIPTTVQSQPSTPQRRRSRSRTPLEREYDFERPFNLRPSFNVDEDEDTPRRSRGRRSRAPSRTPSRREPNANIPSHSADLENGNIESIRRHPSISDADLQSEQYDDSVFLTDDEDPVIPELARGRKRVRSFDVTPLGDFVQKKGVPEEIEAKTNRIISLIKKDPEKYRIRGDKILHEKHGVRGVKVNKDEPFIASSVRQSVRAILQSRRGEWRELTPPGTAHLENRLLSNPQTRAIIESVPSRKRGTKRQKTIFEVREFTPKKWAIPYSPSARVPPQLTRPHIPRKWSSVNIKKHLQGVAKKKAQKKNTRHITWADRKPTQAEQL